MPSEAPPKFVRIFELLMWGIIYSAIAIILIFFIFFIIIVCWIVGAWLVQVMG